MKQMMIVLSLVCMTASVWAFDMSTLPKYSTFYDAKANPHETLSKALEKSAKSGKKLLLIVGNDGCKWCGQLDNFLEDNRKIAEAFYGSFEVVKVYYAEGINKETKSLLQQFPAPKGTPHFYVLDSNAKLLKSIDTGYLERGYSYNKQKFLAFIEANKQKEKK
jgi:thioredoxin-related protein